MARSLADTWHEEELAREGRAIVNAWAQRQGNYLDIDHYAAEQGIHWTEAYRRQREAELPAKGGR